MIRLDGIGCCLSAVGLYLLGRGSGRDAEILKSVTKVNQLNELAELLDIESRELPLVVAVSGRVASETPISCEQSRLSGVIVETTAEQKFLKHKDNGSSIKDSALMLSTIKEVPWYLDDGTERVYVNGAQGASGSPLTIRNVVFEKSGISLFEGNVTILGVERTEKVLPTGTSLTVVGEAIKNDNGTVRIQCPHKGPFYVSPYAIDELIEGLGYWARFYKYASIGLTVFGLSMIVEHAVH